MNVPGFGWVNTPKDKVLIKSYETGISGGEILSMYYEKCDESKVDESSFNEVVIDILFERFSVEVDNYI